MAHPLEGVKEFWHKLNTPEKVGLVVVVAGVAGYALYVRYKTSQQASSSPTGTSAGPVDQNGNPLYATDLSGVYSGIPGTFDLGFNTGTNTSTGTGTTTGTGTGTTTSTGSGSGTSPTSLSGPPILYTTKAGDTIEAIYLAHKGVKGYWGDVGIKSRNANLKIYGLSSKLPAGLRIQIGGPQAGTA